MKRLSLFLLCMIAAFACTKEPYINFAEGQSASTTFGVKGASQTIHFTKGS